jgi:tetratricopeptide (TPR) repeat protein
VTAEKSFSTALYLNTNNAEALNGLGLARIGRGRPQEAARFFEAAAQYHPDYAPAILNLAVVNQEYLRDNRTALQNYRAYLELAPRPADWDEVNALAENLEHPSPVAMANPQQPQNQPPAPTVEIKTQATDVVHPVAPTKPPVVARTNSSPLTHPNPPQQIAKTQTPSPSSDKPSVMHRLNPGNRGNQTPPEKYTETGVTPLPPPDSANDRVGTTPAVSNSAPASVVSNLPPPKPMKIAAPAPPTFPRYLYLSPRKPKSGDRVAASGDFTRARGFEQDSQWRDAMESYRQAAKSDPGWFEAQYNFGVMSYRLRNFPQSLEAYEMALAIEPDSVDARYNFALALKAAGYAVDAVNELKKITAQSPDEVRAHLALGNLYAQQLLDMARARQEYLKVLALDPRNPQATDIRFWLSQNPA